MGGPQNASPPVPQRSSTASTRARASARYIRSVRLVPSQSALAVEVIHPQVARMVGEHLFDLRLRDSESLARLAQPLDALLEELEGLVELQVLGLEPSDDLLEPLELPGEAQLFTHGDPPPSPRLRRLSRAA